MTTSRSDMAKVHTRNMDSALRLAAIFVRDGVGFSFEREGGLYVFRNGKTQSNGRGVGSPASGEDEAVLKVRDEVS